MQVSNRDFFDYCYSLSNVMSMLQIEDLSRASYNWVVEKGNTFIKSDYFVKQHYFFLTTGKKIVNFGYVSSCFR